MLLPYLVQANNTSMAECYSLPEESSQVKLNTMMSEVALGGMIPTVAFIILVAIVRILRVHSMHQQARIKPEDIENSDQLNTEL